VNSWGRAGTPPLSLTAAAGLFRELLAMGFDILTYRKGRTRHIAEKRFTRHKAKLDGRPVEYLLHDQSA